MEQPEARQARLDGRVGRIVFNFIYLFICLSVCLFVYLFIYLYPQCYSSMLKIVPIMPKSDSGRLTFLKETARSQEWLVLRYSLSSPGLKRFPFTSLINNTICRAPY